ncbi:hypothetical protein [Spongiibacter sp.]|uniref:hypothetical protein n=1 Tax=Spongiibacter sp. TaxID=2024860 RepID=UPI003562D8F0
MIHSPRRGMILPLALFCTILAGCATTETPAAITEGFISCEQPRPQRCTREYRPVCGHVDTGMRCLTQDCTANTHQSYGNACSACADQRVIGYEQGSCESYGKGQQ